MEIKLKDSFDREKLLEIILMRLNKFENYIKELNYSQLYDNNKKYDKLIEAFNAIIRIGYEGNEMNL